MHDNIRLSIDLSYFTSPGLSSKNNTVIECFLFAESTCTMLTLNETVFLLPGKLNVSCAL